jgi:hypothetical protein
MADLPLKAHAGAWSMQCEARERAQDSMEVHARDIERAARAWLKDEGKIKRTGQSPTLTAVNEFHASFDVTNGIDYHDDFQVDITWADLEEYA